MSGYDWGWDEDEDPEWREDDYDEGAEEDEWVLDCGFEGCLMPGYHFRNECHNVEMMQAQEEEALRDSCSDSG